MREIQDFERENISMSQPTLDSKNVSISRPPLESTHNVFNTNNGTTTSIDSIPIITKTPEPTLLTEPTEFLEQNGNVHVPDDPGPDQPLSESSSKKNKCDKTKIRKKYNKDDSSDPLSNDGSDSSNDSYYRRKQLKS